MSIYITTPPTVGSGITIGDTVTSGTTGSVLFIGAGPVLAQDNATFFWDDTNNFLGIGTNIPAQRIESVNSSSIQLRLSHTVTTAYVDIGSGSTGNLSIYPLGGKVNIEGNKTGTLGRIFMDCSTVNPVFQCRIGTAGGGSNVAWQFYNSSAASFFALTANQSSGVFFETVGTLPLVFRSNSVEVVRLSSSTTQAQLVTIPSSTLKGLVVKCASSQTASAVEVQSSGSTPYVTIGPDTLAGDTTNNWLAITGTMPSTLTATCRGVNIAVTGAGSSSFENDAMRIAFSAGYTGSSACVALALSNTNAGTGTGTLTAASGNFGGCAQASVTTTGYNAGFHAEAGLGNLNTGIQGITTQAKNSATNIGIYGASKNTGSSPVQVAGYFVLDDAGTAPTVSAALIANNKTQTSDIFRAEDNGTTAFSVIDGGSVGIGTGAPTASLTIIPNADSTKGMILKGFSSGYNTMLTEWQSYTGSVVASMQYTGDLIANSFSNVTNPDTATNGFYFTATATKRFNVLVDTTTANHEAELLLQRKRSASYSVTAGDFMGAITWNTMSFLRGLATANSTGGFSTIDMVWNSVNAAGATADRIFFTAEGKLGVNASAPAGMLQAKPDTTTTIGIVSKNIASQTSNAFEAHPSGSSTPYVAIGPSTLSGNFNTDAWLYVTGTLPTQVGGATDGIVFNVTTPSESTSSHEYDGLRVLLNAGYTGNGYTIGAYVVNSAAGTGTGAISGGNANYGAYLQMVATTTGHNVGFLGDAGGGAINYGTISTTIRAKNSAKNIAIFGVSRNTGSSPVEVGGWFILSANPAVPTVSAAVIADNGQTTANIFRAEDNSTAVFTILDGGNVAMTNLISTYNNVATTNWGVPAIYGTAARATGQTARSAAVSVYTVGASDGSFEVSGNVNVTTSVSHSFSLDVAYTDETNTAQTLVLPMAQLTGSFVSGGLITNLTGVGPYESSVMHIRCKASTTITIRPSNGTFTSVTYNAEGIIKQMA